MSPSLIALALALAPQAPAAGSALLEPTWTLDVGTGFARPVVAEGSAYVLARDDGAALVAVDVAAGTTRWRATFADGRREDQERMGGEAPHADPLVHRGVVLALGFAGRLHAFDAAEGAPRWSLDLVETLGAEAVQFGFAASPIALDELVVVAAGAPGPGYAALDPTTGEVRWRSARYAASYVTPVLAEIDGARQLVCCTGDEVVGLDPADGAELWRLPHVVPGQTNFATLHVGELGAVYVSGQGSRGLRRIDVARAEDGWSASEAWLARRAQLEQGRSVRAGGLIYGGTSTQLCCVDEASGELVFRLRGFAPCALEQAGARTILLQEDGTLVVGRLAPDRLEVLARAALGGERCWTAPVVLGERVLVRAAGALYAFELPAADAAPLEVVETGGAPPEDPEIAPTGVVSAWNAAERARILGEWTIGGEILVRFRELEDGALVATSSAYPDVTFGVEPETTDRAWIRALDASYGIPPVRLEAGDTPRRLVLFQGGDALEAVR